MPAKKLAIASVVLVVVAAAVTGYLLWEPDEALPQTADRSADVQEVYAFDTVGEMAATSHIVIKATVTKVEAGVKVGDPGEELTNRNVHLDVDAVLYQRDGHKPGDSVTIVEGHWDTDGVGVALGAMKWTRPGDTGYYFLMDPEDSGVYGFASSNYGRVTVTDDTAHLAASSGANPEDEGPWAAANADFGDLDGIEKIIDEAVADAESGKAEPAESIAD